MNNIGVWLTTLSGFPIIPTLVTTTGTTIILTQP